MPMLLIVLAAVSAILAMAGISLFEDGPATVHVTTGLAGAVGVLALAVTSLFRDA